MHTTHVENIRCFQCGTLVQQIVRHHGFQAGGTSIGPSAISCPNCGTWLATNATEWDEKGLFRKTWFVAVRLLWFVFGAGLIAGCLGACIGMAAVQVRWIKPELRIPCALLAQAVFTLLIGWIMLRNALKEIRDSRRRVADAEADSPAEE